MNNLNQMQDEYIKVKAEMERIKENFAENVKPIIESEILNFLEKYPEVEKVGWTQFTPFFNDGDPCEFSVGEFCFKLKDEYSADNIDDEFPHCSSILPTQDWLDFFKPRGYSEHISNVEKLIDSGWDFEKMERDFRKLKTDFLFQIDDEIFEKAFGDHAIVEVTRKNGLTVDEFDHD